MQRSIYRQTFKQLTQFKLRLAMLPFKANIFQSTTMLFDNICSICNMYLFWKIQWSFSRKSSGKWKAWKLPHTTLSKSFESLLWSGLHKQLKSCFMFISFYFVVFIIFLNLALCCSLIKFSLINAKNCYWFWSFALKVFKVDNV